MTCSYKDESCHTTDGGLATWVENETMSQTKVVWMDSAQVSEGIIDPSELQKAYNLIGPIKTGKMKTQEGIHLNNVSNSRCMVGEGMRKRDTTVTDAVNVIHGETNG